MIIANKTESCHIKNQYDKTLKNLEIYKTTHFASWKTELYNITITKLTIYD